MGFSDEAILLLSKLDQADGEGWDILEHFSGELIGSMKRNKHIEENASSVPPLYRITDKGHEALLKEVAAPAKQKNRKAKVSTLYENGNGMKPVVPARGQEAVNTQVRPFSELVAEACQPDECAGCVYRQVVEILAARVPGVNELVTALKLLNKV